MRWIENKVEQPEYGDKRVTTKFLFLPKKINGQTRWLEFAKYEEVFRAIPRKTIIDHSRVAAYASSEWVALRWVD